MPLRVLFDKNVPHGVRQFLSRHQVETVDEKGWERISNGELLQAAEVDGFEVVITADQNIVYQQISAKLDRTKDRASGIGLKHLANRPHLRRDDC